MWANSSLEYVETWQNRDVHLRHTLHLQPSNPPARPPILCLCLELEWLVFHFGLPGALVHSLAWPVYHYWSLSLTWTNRGLFSKVVSQVAVTDMSGTTQLDLSAQGAREREKKSKTQQEHKPDWIIRGRQTFLITKTYCSRAGQRLGVLFLIRSGLAKSGQTILLQPLPTTAITWYWKQSTEIPSRIINSVHLTGLFFFTINIFCQG